MIVISAKAEIQKKPWMPDQVRHDGLFFCVFLLMAVLVCQSATWALGEIGDVGAVEPLIVALLHVKGSDDYARLRNIVNSLYAIINKAARNIDEDCLRRISQLGSVDYWVIRPSCQGGDYYQEFDCSHLKQLARQELIRRGIET